MKRISVIVLIAIVSLMLFSSCEKKTVTTEPEPISITYAEIYEANTYAAVTSNHKSIYLKDNILVGSENFDSEYYWGETGYSYLSYPYTDADGNPAKILYFITNEGTYLCLEPMTAENASYDIVQYYMGVGIPSIESVSAFSLVAPEYNQTITECKKTENGYEVTGENSDGSFVSIFRSSYFQDENYAEGDKITFKFELNEKYEMLKFDNYYVSADGSDPINCACGEFVYDGNDCPDYIKNVNSILENGAKDTSVKIYAENDVVDVKVYSDILVFYSDYEVYTDAEYTDLLSNADGYYMFGTESDIALYLKAPAAEE